MNLKALSCFVLIGIYAAQSYAYDASAKSVLAQPSLSLSLLEVYQLAEKRSESLEISREEIKIAEAQYWQSISSILPRLDFLATERTQNSAGSSISGGDSTGNRKDSFQGRLRVTQTIFNGFREFNIGASLQAQKRSKEALYTRSKELLYLDVSDLFYQILSLEQDQILLQQINESFSQRRQELTQRIEIGRSRKSELLAGETEQADTAALLEEVIGLQGASRELLAFLIGVPADRWNLKDSLMFPQADKLNDYLWKSGARADVTAAGESQTAAQRQVSADKGAFWPKISAEANYLALEDPERNQEWNIILTAEIPIFDGGLRMGALKESEARYRSSSLSFSRARRLAESEVRQSYNNFISSARQYVKLQEAALTAQKNVEAQAQDYLLGRASNLDFLNAQVRSHTLQRRLNGLAFQTRSNLVALQVAAGEPVSLSEKSRQSPGNSAP